MNDEDECSQPLLEQRNSHNAANIDTDRVVRNRVRQKMPKWTGQSRPKCKYSTENARNKTYHDDLTSESTSRTTVPEQNAVSKTRWKSLLAFTKGQHLIVLGSAGIFSLLSGLLSPALAILLGNVFNHFSDFGASRLEAQVLRNQVSVYSFYLGILGLLSWALYGGFLTSWLIFGQLQAKVAEQITFDGLASWRLGWYDMQTSGTGALLTRIQSQVRELQLATSQPLGYAIQYLITSVASLAIAFYYSWSLTLVIISTIPVSAIVLAWLSNHLQPYIQSQRQHLNDASKLASTTIANIVTVKCFNGQDAESIKYADAIVMAARQYFNQTRINAIQIGFMRLVTFGMFVQGFWYGHHLVSMGQKTTGDVVTCFWSCLTATQAVERVLPHVLVLEKGKLAGAYLRSTSSGVLTTQSGNVRPQNCKGRITLRSVSFSYPARPHYAALKDFSGTFPPGETTFLIGHSGSGKSTVGQILMRFYDKTRGSISFDGQPLEDLDINWLRQHVMYVGQTSVLFSGTIRENIAIGKSGQYVYEDEVKNAVQFALLEEAVGDLPAGLETVINGQQVSLSGGQMQRVALARARLRGCPVLILDEATSALDHTSRSLIMKAIRKWREGKTNIVITHDLAHIQPSDTVFLLKEGRVVKSGFGHSISADAQMQKTVIKDEVLQQSVSPMDNRAPAQRKPSFDVSGSNSHSYAAASDRNWVPARDTPIISTSRMTGDYSTLSLFPSMFTGATPSPTSTGPSWSSTLAGKGQSGASLNRTRTLHSVCLSPARSAPLQRVNKKPAARGNTARMTQFELELMELTGVRAVEARLGDFQPDRRRRASIRKPNGENTSMERSPPAQLTQPTKPIEKAEVSLWLTLRTVWGTQNLKRRTSLVIGFGSAACHASLTPVFSYVFSKLLATFFDELDGTRKAMTYSLIIIAIAIADALACFLMYFLLERCGQIWIDTYRRRALARILDQSLEWFDRGTNGVAQLTQTLDRHAEEMRNLLGRFAAFLVVAVVMMAMAIVWSVAVSWKLTLVGLSVVPFSLFITRTFQAVSAKWERLSNDASESSATIRYEVFNNIKAVRALTLESYFKDRHMRCIKDGLRIGLKRAIYCGVLFGLSEALIMFTEALVFYYGAVLVSTEQYTVQDILTVFAMLLFSFANLSAIIAFVPQVQSSKISAQQLLQLTRLPALSHEHEGTLKPHKISHIRFNKLTWAYPAAPNDPILQRINLPLQRGITAIVGPSGSGKSTLATLLLRLHLLNSSATPPPLTLNGTDIGLFHTPHLHSQIGYVPQAPVLFPTSIRENIVYGLPLASPFRNDTAIRHAAHSAGIAQFIDSLPAGYDTVVGDGGIGVSGGQAQRLNVARALVREPQLLILDEATSALDMLSAALIRDTLRSLVRLRRDMIVLLVTHAREMMEIADTVVMMQEGEVVEVGRFREMLTQEGPLAEMLGGGVWSGEAASKTKGRTREVEFRGVDWGTEGRKDC